MEMIQVLPRAKRASAVHERAERVIVTVIAPVPPISIGAWCEIVPTRDLLEQVAQDPRMRRARMEIALGGVSTALETLSHAPTPDLLLIENSAERNDLLARLDSLAQVCDAGSKVVIIGDVNDIVLYRELMARGVSEYIVQPFTPVDLVRLLAGLYAHPLQRLVGRVIAVTGAKGGVGTSTLAHHLAAILGRSLGEQVILADMDMGFGTAGLNFNQEPLTSLAEAMVERERVDTNFVERLLTRCEDHLSLLAAPAQVELAHDVAETMIDPVLDGLRAIAPFIVLDLPHGWPDWKRRVLLSADEVVIVAEPDLANLRNAKNIFEYLRAARPDDLHPRLVLNHTGMPKRPEITRNDFEAALGERLLGTIAHDAKLFGTAANKGELAIDLDGGGKLVQMLRPIALTLADRPDLHVSRFPLISPLLGRLRNAFG